MLNDRSTIGLFTFYIIPFRYRFVSVPLSFHFCSIFILFLCRSITVLLPSPFNMLKLIMRHRSSLIHSPSCIINIVQVCFQAVAMVYSHYKKQRMLYYYSQGLKAPAIAKLLLQEHLPSKTEWFNQQYYLA